MEQYSKRVTKPEQNPKIKVWLNLLLKSVTIAVGILPAAFIVILPALIVTMPTPEGHLMPDHENVRNRS
jgi:hypothetical protein